MRSKTLCALAVTAGTLAAGPAASAAAPPANDAFETPAGLGDASVRGTLDEATRQPGEPATGFQTVWFLYQPSKSGRVAIEVPSQLYMTAQVGVYTGAALPDLQRVARGNVRAAFDALAGQSYRVAVGSQHPTGTDSSFTVRVRAAPLPTNDAFSEARSIRIPGEYRGNLADATAELGENERHSHSVWYRIRPRRTVDLTAELDDSACSHTGRLTLYTGNRLSSLREIRSGTIRYKVRRGRVYRLAVDCSYPLLGDFRLSLSDGSIKGKGVKLAVDAGQTVDSVREGGLRMKVSAKRRVGVGIELRVSRAVARRLGLNSRVLGRTSGAVDYGKSLPAVLRLTRAARRALADVEHLRAVARLEILRTDAPNRVLTVPVSL